jgi:phosphatidylserine decarboxylase
MKIHKEGHVFLIALLFILGGINFTLLNFTSLSNSGCCVVIICSSILYLFFLQFFRSPKKTIELNDKHIIAPADGKIVVIEKTPESEFFKGAERIQISIFMSPLNVHVNRNPVTGLIKYFKYHPGKYLVAWHPKSSTDNERTTIVYELHKGVQILVRQIAGAVARRIKWYVEADQSVIQGKEFGFIKFGSRVDLFLPLDTQINVKIGDKTVGGKTVLAEFS